MWSVSVAETLTSIISKKYFTNENFGFCLLAIVTAPVNACNLGTPSYEIKTCTYLSTQLKIFDANKRPR